MKLAENLPSRSAKLRYVDKEKKIFMILKLTCSRSIQQLD